MSSSSRKRSRPDDNDHDHDNNEASSTPARSDRQIDQDTPRASKFAQTRLPEWSPFSACHIRNSPSRTSSTSNQSAPSSQSRHGAVSNKSSPSKQFRNAELNESGFSVGNFSRHAHPENLKNLRLELRDIGAGYGFLPASLESELRAFDFEIPPYAFDKNEATRAKTEATAASLPSFSWIKGLVDRAVVCQTDREGEASWNADVHAPILEQVFRSDRFTSRDMVDFRWCPSAQILPAYRPRDAPSKMVDFCLFIRPDPGSSEERVIEAVCRLRPGQSINHTDLGNFCKHPIALSIETKRPGEQGESATLQMGTWLSAQWRSLQGPFISFLPGLIVQGHVWQFVASIKDESGKPLLLQTVHLGSTDTEIGAYSLIVGLQRLKRWVKDEYWRMFIASMLSDVV
ncbi:hypothetical protein B0J13DRAFT_447773 [Dactylonectria estremocensis]|uniref:PD-(D/E)XK nuclease-like domain-containing protein n=1 Tax=Dactylonectria estremocensis TaxID=1079267 RepID=A0A9P9EHE8_9HYPO|nr:hypothetical protein B0J13DRAFT_447773 [Dactylonectria estremocensis]